MAAWTSIVVLVGAAWLAWVRPGGALLSGWSRGAPWHKGPNYSHHRCRCFPSDSDGCWPSQAEWAAFNATVGGRLIATVPVASVCHGAFGVSYDADKCAEVRANWPRPEFHDETTHSPMAAFFANASCDPFTAPDAPCVIGTYVRYAVNATGADHYRSTIAFATRHNIRLVIRNTGHDYMGKSTGAGALALWTHHVKSRSILDYKSSVYTGKAMKMGAGVQAVEAQRTANDAGLVVVEGDCPTVGLAGGYTQGGGTSPLASRYGLAADQVLEWEVVTSDGELRRATPTNENADLYWALSGGGGGTYGAVLSMTVKLDKNMATAGATLSFVDATDAYWHALRAFLINLPAVLRAGATVYWQIIPPVHSGLPGNLFSLPQLYLPGGTATDVKRLLQPTLAALDHNGISYAFTPTDYPTFQDAFYTLNPWQNISEVNLGGRLIPRSLVANDKSAAALTQALKSIADNGGITAGVSMDVSRPPLIPNSANPEWRESLFLAFLGIPYDRNNFAANLAAQAAVTNVLLPPLEALTPGGAAYLNEADINQKNWQQVFYGKSYPRLLLIKKRYDPDGIFWGPTTVGSEAWEQTADGRLCKTSV